MEQNTNYNRSYQTDSQENQERAQQQRQELEDQFYRQLEESDTLVDYFCLIGLDQQVMAEMLQERLPRSQMIERLNDMKPALLSKFPPKNKKGLRIDAEHVMELPRRASEVATKHSSPQQQQNNQSERGTTLNTNFTQFANDPQVEENQRGTHIFKDIPQKDISHALLINTNQEEEKKNYSNFGQQQSNGKKSHSPLNALHHQNSSPLKPTEKSQFSQQNEQNSRSQQSILGQKMQRGNTMPISTGKHIYIPKALCLLSRYPFFDYFNEILDDLYNASTHHVINVIEAYINKLVLECPAPPRGLARVIYERHSKPGTFLEIMQPPINELPYVNRSFFDTLFKNLSPDLIVMIFTHLLVERSVLIVSPQVEYLLPIITALINLIHPFEWTICMPFINKEPDQERDDSTLYSVAFPGVYINGMLDKDLNDAIDILNEDQDKAKPLIVLIQQQRIHQFKPQGTVLEDGQAVRNHARVKQIQTPQLPQKLHNALLTKLKTVLKNENPTQMLSEEAISEIRNAFYNVLLELFVYYKEFVGKDNDGDVTFDIKRFCQISNKQYREFYQQFFFTTNEMQDRLSNGLFQNFISKQQVNNFNSLECAIIHFNESIYKIQDGETGAPYKRPQAFLLDKSQNINQQVSTPPVQYSQFSDQELRDSYLMLQDNTTKLYPIENNKDEDSNNGYRYSIFPILNPLLYESSKIFKIELLAENLENKLQTQEKYRTESKPQAIRSLFQRQKINIPYVSRIEGTYVHITWIYMWCASLWMQDEREKFFRLMQVLQVIAKLKAEYIQRPQLDLFFLLIETSFHYGSMKMTQKIYETLPKYDLKPDARIQQRYLQHLNLSKKKQTTQKRTGMANMNNTQSNLKKSEVMPGMSGNKKESIVNEREAKINQRDLQFLIPDSRLYRQVKYQQQFRHRTFKQADDVNIMFDEVKLKLQEQCKHCKGQLLAAQLRKAIENMHILSQKTQNKKIQALCTYCGKDIEEPQLQVMIGKRIRNLPGSYKEENTTFFSAAVLHKWLEIEFFEAEDLKLNFQHIRSSNKNVFWNMIYYFNDYQLPFDFILPYEDSKEFDLRYEELKRTSKAVKVFQVKDDIEEAIEEQKDGDDENGEMNLGTRGKIQVGKFH